MASEILVSDDGAWGWDGHSWRPLVAGPPTDCVAVQHLKTNWYFHPPMTVPPWGLHHNAYADGYLFTDPASQARHNPTAEYLAWEIRQPGGRRVPQWQSQPHSPVKPQPVHPTQPTTAEAKGAAIFWVGLFIICTVLAMEVHPLWMAFFGVCVAVGILKRKNPVAYHTMNVALAADNVRRMHKENVQFAGKTIGQNNANQIAMGISAVSGWHSAAWLYRHYRRNNKP